MFSYLSVYICNILSGVRSPDILDAWDNQFDFYFKIFPLTDSIIFWYLHFSIYLIHHYFYVVGVVIVVVVVIIIIIIIIIIYYYYLFLFRSARSIGLRQCLAIRGSCFSFLDPLDIW
jgi:hypothetical protein